MSGLLSNKDRILIVEDREEIRHILSELLTTMGYVRSGGVRKRQPKKVL